MQGNRVIDLEALTNLNKREGNQMEQKENVHKNHRDRLRKKFIENDIESLQPHEVLELLLFYAYRQRDTNEIAHRLLKKFGSISGVFEADIASLQEVEDVGYNTAVFLKLQGNIQRYYMKEKYSKMRNLQITPQNIGEYVKHLFYGYTDEVFYVISLNSKCEVISADIMSKGTVNSSVVYSREVVKKVLETKADFVILAHNHPNGMLAPSDDDVKTTKVLTEALNFINVKVIDHVIVARGEHISLFKDYKIL